MNDHSYFSVEIEGGGIWSRDVLVLEYILEPIEPLLENWDVTTQNMCYENWDGTNILHPWSPYKNKTFNDTSKNVSLILLKRNWLTLTNPFFLTFTTCHY